MVRPNAPLRVLEEGCQVQSAGAWWLWDGGVRMSGVRGTGEGVVPAGGGSCWSLTGGLVISLLFLLSPLHTLLVYRSFLQINSPATEETGLPMLHVSSIPPSSSLGGHAATETARHEGAVAPAVPVSWHMKRPSLVLFRCADQKFCPRGPSWTRAGQC